MAQENAAMPAADSSQVEFYISMEDYLNKNILTSVHITILSVTENIYEIFGASIDFKVENDTTKEENDFDERSAKMIL